MIVKEMFAQRNNRSAIGNTTSGIMENGSYNTNGLIYDKSAVITLKLPQQMADTLQSVLSYYRFGSVC